MSPTKPSHHLQTSRPRIWTKDTEGNLTDIGANGEMQIDGIPVWFMEQLSGMIKLLLERAIGTQASSRNADRPVTEHWEELTELQYRSEPDLPHASDQFLELELQAFRIKDNKQQGSIPDSLADSSHINKDDQDAWGACYFQN